MQSLYKLQDYLIHKLDYDTYKKEIQPLLLDILNEHYDELMEQSDRHLKKIKSK